MKNIIKSHKGGIVLEAALVLPIFAMFVLSLISLIKINATEMMVQSMVSETTKYVATQAYPIHLAVKDTENLSFGALLNQVNVGKAEMASDEFGGHYQSMISEPILNFLQSAMQYVTGKVQPEIDKVLYAAVKPVVYRFANKNGIDEENLEIVDVDVPSFKNKNDALLAIEVKYTVELPIPFVKREISIYKRAVERIWIGG
ncbi:hypothetical protein [Longirhabdus pacifica]|uniref:hypothetical protein n=1 Tax=Longirhabdus pacifica TaxID=2305227 RepID=UPI0010090759|nr:hypothetical protein [Longirhabdus pacifica]